MLDNKAINTTLHHILKFVFLWIFLLIGPETLAQLKEKIAHLQQKIEKAQTDFEKSEMLIEIAEEYRFINSDSSMAYINKAKQSAKKTKSTHLDVNIAILNAIVWYEKGDYKNSLILLRKIEPLVIKMGDKKTLLKLYQTYGNSFGLSNDYSKAIQYELKALDYAKSLKDSMAMANLYINIGSDFHYIKEYKKGIYYCNNARAIYAQLKQDFYQGFALNNMSNYSNHLKEYQKALHYATLASKYWNEDNNERLMAYLYHNYGKAYKGLKNYQQSEKYYLKSIAIRTKNESPKDLIITRNELADLYIKWNQLSSALAIAEKNYQLSVEKSFTLEEQQSADLLARLYEKKGKLEPALHFIKIGQKLKDSLETREQAKEVLKLQTKYETAEKEKQILNQRAKITKNELELKNRNLWIFGLVALAIIIGFIGFLLYKQQLFKNLKQQKENELKLALEKIETQNKLQEQRLAISRDLHDNIGAQLSFIVSAIDIIKYYIADTNDQVNTKLDNIGTFAKETILELRNTIWAMNKTAITLEDLQSRIANFIQKAEQSQDDTQLLVKLEENISVDLKFTALQGLNIYRIIQEATNNALKYAKTNLVEIRISRDQDTIWFAIQDYGKGFVESEIKAGNGLQNMRKRALELNSKLILISEIGAGTRISFSIPIQ